MRVTHARILSLGTILLVGLNLLNLPSASAAQSGKSVSQHADSHWAKWGHGTTLSGSQAHTAPAHWLTPPEHHVLGGTYAAESSNWSGQLATGSPFSAVAGNWVVPTVQPTSALEASGTWIGVDGGPGSPASILQTGTGQETQNGSTVYYAWYEVYPSPAVVLGLVSPGDQMEASIAQSSGTIWTLSVNDITSGNSASGQLTYTGPGDSAEWIEELPTAESPPQPYLANFGSAQFTEASLTAADPNSAFITPIDMVDSDGNVIAQTGNLANGSFTITYVPEPTTTTVAASPSASSFGSSVTYSATVSSPGPAPTGTVLFSDGSTTLCTAFLSGGSGTCNATDTPQGTDVVQARYSGDANSASSGGTTELSVGAPGPHGYWLVGSDGGIFTFGSAQFYGSTGSLHLQRPVVGITPTSNRGGYWLDASDGGIFAFGNAGFYGSIPGLGLNPAGSGLPHSLDAPIVAMVPSTDGNGYFMVASDGGVFAFGDARFAGSCPGIGGCSGAAVAVMPDASGNGYWLVTQTGHVYTFGDAPYYGAPGPQSVPVTSAVRTPDGQGYWILFSNGAIANFGDARQFGSPAGQMGGLAPATAIFTTADGAGYWVAAANGAVASYGDAPNDGSMLGTRLNGSVIAATGW